MRLAERMRNGMVLSLVVGTALVLGIAPIGWSSLINAAAGDQNWPVFQGARVNFSQAVAPPLAWSPSEHIDWTAKIPGYGQSSPVVWGRRVFVTSVSGPMKENGHILAVDLGTGEKLWQYDLRTASGAANTNYVSRAAPSPVVDAEGLTVLFEGGNLLSLTLDGKLRWQRDLVADYGPVESRHGLASSLEHDDERVFVWMERQAEPYLLAVSKTTGETQWKSEGLGVTSWSSPRLVPVGKGQHLVLSGIGKLAGFDPENGERLWQFDDISGNSTATPMPLGDGQFLTGASEGRGEAADGNSAASNGLMRIEQDAAGKYSAAFVWRAKKATCSFGSPLVHDGHAYFVSRAGVVYCLDSKTGEERYVNRTASSIWATPIAVGGRIYLFGRNGTTTVLKSGPDFEKLAENQLWDDGPAQPAAGQPDAPAFGGPVLYSAAVIGNQILLRRGETLYCVGK